MDKRVIGIVAALAAIGGTGTGFWWASSRLPAPAAPAAPAVPPAAEAAEAPATPQAPPELAGAAWGTDCSEEDLTFRYVDGHAVQAMGGQLWAQDQVRYQRTAEGWKVIGPVETAILTGQGEGLRLEGKEVAGVRIRLQAPKTLRRCPALALVDPRTDVPPKKTDDPLRHALWLAVAWKDAEAVKQIVAKLPNLDGKFDGVALDDMLAATSPEIVRIVRDAQGAAAAASPEDPYAVAGQPWRTVPAYPEPMQAEFSIVGCGGPSFRFQPTAREYRFNGEVEVTRPRRIAVSGDRVYVQEQDGRGVVYELQADGSLSQLALLTASGALAPNNQVKRVERCSPAPAAMAEAPAPTPAVAQAEAAAPRAAPVRPRAAPRTDPRLWFSMRDYPAEALRQGRQGDVQYTLVVDEAGMPRRCMLRVSSGFGDLDEATCRVVMGKARFDPATDAQGKPVASQVTGAMQWRIPQGGAGR